MSNGGGCTVPGCVVRRNPGAPFTNAPAGSRPTARRSSRDFSRLRNPFSAAGRPLWTLEAFTIFDDSRVHVELLSAQVTVTAPSEITLYVRAFEKLAELAVHAMPLSLFLIMLRF